MAEVVLEHVEKRFGDFAAVHDFNVEIRDGEFVVLVGPSGCGKSTILRMIAGLEDVSGGNIRIDGTVVNDVPPKDRDVAMVFQSYALYPHMNVYDNMSLALRAHRAPRAEIERRVKEAAQILGITDQLGKKPGQLSGGQRQRVALGRAIVRHPKVFLFDEPLSNLDAKLRVAMRAELARLHQRLGATMIYVTHDQAEAMTLGDRVVVLKAGRTQQVAAPEELYDHPANLFVAGFVGSPAMNIMRVTLADGSGGLGLRARDLYIPLPEEMLPLLKGKGIGRYIGQDLTFGIRPEDIHDAGTGIVPEFPGFVQGRVEVVESMGSDVFVHLGVAGEELLARLGRATQARVGDLLKVALDLSKIHLFNPATEEALV